MWQMRNNVWILYTGLITVLNMGRFLDKKNAEVQGADYIAVAPSIYENKLMDILHQIDTVSLNAPDGNHNCNNDPAVLSSDHSGLPAHP
jgi:hypothetical protein